MTNHSFIKALKENSKKPIITAKRKRLSLKQRDKDYNLALKILGIKPIKNLTISDLDEVYLKAQKAHDQGKINDQTFCDICQEMTIHGVGNIFDKCQYGADIIAVADSQIFI